MLRLTEVRINQAARDNVEKVLDSGQLSQGRMVGALEEQVAHVSGAAHAVAVSSATAGLGLLLAASGFRPGDEIAIPAFSYVATANVPLALGGRIRFVDVDDNLLMPKTEAEWTLPVHLYGQRAPSGSVEDAAQAIGMRLTNAVVSFYGSKTVGCGEGGMILTDDPDVAERCRLWRNHGSVATYVHVGFGLNFRMTDLQAAVALGQLSTLNEVLAARRRNAELLNRRLKGVAKLPGPGLWHQYVVEVPNRDFIRKTLAAGGIESKPVYPYALPDIPHLPDADTPRARQAAGRNLALPVHEHLTTEDVERIADAVLGASCGYGSPGPAEVSEPDCYNNSTQSEQTSTST